MEARMHNIRLINAAGTDLEVQDSVPNVLEKVLTWAARIFDLDACAVLLHDEESDTLRIASSRGYRPEVAATFRTRPGEGVTGLAFARGRPVLVRDVQRELAYIKGVEGANCEMAVPLLVQGRPVGVLDAEARRTEPFTSDDIDLFELFASHVTSAVQNARLLVRTRGDEARLAMRASDLGALAEAGLRLATFTDLEELVQGVMATARKALPFRSCALLLADGDDLVVRGVFGFDEGMGVGFRLGRGRGLAWRCLDGCAPLLADDVRNDPDLVSGVRGARCQMAAPILGPSGAVGALVAESPKPAAFNGDSLSLFATFAHQVAAAIENARLHETNRDTFYQTIRALAQALEMRDSYTHGHSERVTRYAVRMGRALGVRGSDLAVVEQAGLLHDIGKIGVRDAVLLKPGRLDGREREAIERHPIIGDSILHPVGFLASALQVVLHHHEHWDGTGYPSGLKGEEIPLVARIIAVADTYDAMTSRRPYREPMRHATAVEEIGRLAGTQFDPAVVAAFLTTIASDPKAPEPAEEAGRPTRGGGAPAYRGDGAGGVAPGPDPSFSNRSAFLR